MTSQAVWRTDDPCPLCGTGLTTTTTVTTVTTADGIQTDQYCNLCGWSITWQADLDLTADHASARHGGDAR